MWHNTPFVLKIREVGVKKNTRGYRILPETTADTKMPAMFEILAPKYSLSVCNKYTQ